MERQNHFKRYDAALVFAVLSVTLLFMNSPAERLPVFALRSWSAANFMTLAMAYVVDWARVFGKANDGSLRGPRAIFMIPLHLFIVAIWRLQNWLLRSSRYSEIVPDLFVGRICQFDELPAGITQFIDLTSEFETPISVRTNVSYVCLPTLDGCPPNLAAAEKILERMSFERHRTYVCCGLGHGRSVTFAALWLGYVGKCRSADEAMTLIQKSRPAAKPNRMQRAFLKMAYQRLGAPT